MKATMVYIKLVLLALVASLWEVTEAGCVRRVKVNPYDVLPYVPRAVPRIICSGSRERALENIISKLISALIVTNLDESRGSGGGGGGVGGGIGGGSGGGGGNGGSGGSGSPLTLASLLGIDISALGQTLLDLEVLPDSIVSD